ncbi:MAG TPA: hypothetical protein VLX44_17180 [Xanthobacteraceae bacterium]|nr:hypothetical protein [Xanthobacteraceae bacterium]
MVTTRARTRKQGPRFSAALAMLWRSFCRDAFDAYRPELHYMRGPGPKWHAKHGRAAQPTGPVAHVATAIS